MLPSKGIESIEELKKYFSIPEKKVDYLLDLLKFFDFKRIHKKLDVLKRQGSSISSILSVLVILPFLNQASVHALLRSGSKNMAGGGKDVFYRTKNRQDIDWRGFLTSFVKRFLAIVAEKGENDGAGPRCLILDDSYLPKVGTKAEFVGRVFDHVTHRFVIGLRLLQLCFYDGKSTIPIDFSIHREKGKNASKPYGLTKSQLKSQAKGTRIEGKASHLRAKEVDESKMKTGMEMIKRGLKFLKVDYVLMDSWFTCESMIECIRGKAGSKKAAEAHLIGMMKMGKAKYLYKGRLYDAASLLKCLKRTIKASNCKKLKASYIVADVMYKDYPVRIYFSRFGKRGKWHILLSTDKSLSYIRMMEIYRIRWSIEVFFHEGKGLLKLGKCQSTSFEAQIADATISMIQYILLTLKKRFEDYETRGQVFREVNEQMQERKLHVRLWELLLVIVKMVIEALDVTIDDIDEVVTKMIKDNKLNGIANLISIENQT